MPKKQPQTGKLTQTKSKNIIKQEILNRQAQNNERKQVGQTKPNRSIENNKKQKDQRFAAAEYDPKFKTPSANIGKVQIDQRFAQKLQSQKFRIAGTVDKYGRKQVQTQDMAGMADYYYTKNNFKQQQISGTNNKHTKKQQKQKAKPKIIQQQHQQQQQQQQQQSQDAQNRISRWMQDYNQQSSSQQQDNQNNKQADDDYMSDEADVWSEHDQDVIKGEHVQATKRLALCNYDWMNISAKDLLLLFSSFKTSTGTVLAVRVYYSQIGKQKMELQDRYGPQGIWSSKTNNTQQTDKLAKSKSKRAEQQAFNQSKLRQYQKQRLKYCYAIIECNSSKTADQIYRQCDGNQFENSNILFDLRFVPDETKFDKEMLKEKCQQLPTKGEVKNFISRALGHSHVGLTWEDPQLNSTAGLKKKNWNKMSDKQMDNIDWGLYMNQEDQNADQNYNKIIKKNKPTDQEDNSDSQKKVQNVSDWRRESNKKYKNKDDDIEISFPSGFDSQIASKSEKPSLNKQVKTKKERWRQQRQQKQKRRHQQMELLVQKQKGPQFKYNPEDERFKAVLDNPSYYIDPSNPKFDHRKTGAVFEHIVKQNRKKNLQ